MENLLTRDHSKLDALAAEIRAALAADDAARVYQTLDLFWARLAMHIRAEHLHLFPALREGFESPPAREICGVTRQAVESRIIELKSDHEFFMRELAESVKLLRARGETNRQTENRAVPRRVHEMLSGVFARLEIHNELEESEVYRWTDALLAPAERAALEKRMLKEIENLPPRFASGEGEKS